MVHFTNSGDFLSESERASCRNVKLDMAHSLGLRNKRRRIDSILQQQFNDTISLLMNRSSQYNPLEEPSPLGLKLKKSSSLVEQIQTKLSKKNPSHGSGLKNECKGTATATSSSRNKIKASNFPASLLKIGSWEYKSRYDNDLVGKCYFSKHKLVWEFLEGCLNSKMEIDWSDIIALKAHCPDYEPGTLTVVLNRPPLFFKEADSLPRKHTLWHSSPDFTDGQASLYRQHFLQCPPGFLNKHFDKLIQCDMRLNVLSRQPEIVLDWPYFEKQSFTFEETKESEGCAFDKVDTDKGSDLLGFQDVPLPAAASQSSSLIVEQQDFSSIAFNGSQVATSQKVTDSTLPINPEEIKVPGLLPPSIPMHDALNHFEDCISETMTAGNPQFTAEELEWIENLLFDSQFPAASDEKDLMSRFDSFCNIVQKDPISVQNLQVNAESIFEGSGDGDIQCNNFESMQTKDSSINPGGELKDVSSSKQACTMPREDSFSDMPDFPRIESLTNCMLDVYN